MIIVIDNKTYILDSSYINSFKLIRLDKIEKNISILNIQKNMYLLFEKIPYVIFNRLFYWNTKIFNMY